MYDNKIRLSQDVLEKAEIIAQEWGLKNARAAVEAVFRRYADEYLGRRSSVTPAPLQNLAEPVIPPPKTSNAKPPQCEALNELDELLGL